MKTLPLLLLLVTAICLAEADDNLECYQCNPVTQECTAAKADTIKCGSKMNSRCLKQTKKGATDLTMAMRKCAVPGPDGKVPCPDGSTCQLCEKNLCNAGDAVKVSGVVLVGLLAFIFV